MRQERKEGKRITLGQERICPRDCRSIRMMDHQPLLHLKSLPAIYLRWLKTTNTVCVMKRSRKLFNPTFRYVYLPDSMMLSEMLQCNGTQRQKCAASNHSKLYWPHNGAYLEKNWKATSDRWENTGSWPITLRYLEAYALQRWLWLYSGHTRLVLCQLLNNPSINEDKRPWQLTQACWLQNTPSLDRLDAPPPDAQATKNASRAKEGLRATVPDKLITLGVL